LDENQKDKLKEIGIFIFKTLFYSVVIFVLLYFFHYKYSDSGGFIYNEF